MRAAARRTIRTRRSLVMARETTDVLFARYGPRFRGYVTTVALLGTVSAVVTTTSVNVALPSIMGSFGIGQDQAQWLVTGTLAAMTVGQLMSAWLIDSFGQRRTFVGALAVFVTALIVAGSAPNETVLILARVVHGLIAGILQSLTMYTLMSVFPPEKRGFAMGFWSVNVIFGPAIGPTLGGLLIEYFNWRYVFYVAVPTSVAGMIFGSVFMPEREETTRRADFDWAGFVLLCVTVSCTLTALSNGQREGWSSDFVLGLFGTAAVAGAAFVLRELNVLQPLVNLRVLGTGQFAAAAGVAVVFGMGQMGTTYLIPLFVQTVQGNTALAAGLLLMPGALLMGLFMPLGGYLADRFSARLLLMTGLTFFAASTWLLRDVDTNTPYLLILACVVVSRGGQALINPTLIATALRTLQSQLLRQGAGMINFCRQMGGAFGVNLLSVMLDRRTFYHSSALTSEETSGNSATRQLLDAIGQLLEQAGAPPDLQSAGALHYLGKVVYAQGYTLAFRDCFLIVSAFFVIALIPAWIVGRRRRNAVAVPHPENSAAPSISGT